MGTTDALIFEQKAKERIAALEQENERLKADFERMRDDRDEAHKRIDALQSELSDYAKTTARLRDELERAKTRIKELQEIYQ